MAEPTVKINNFIEFLQVDLALDLALIRSE